jgi:hypothetical protein
MVLDTAVRSVDVVMRRQARQNQKKDITSVIASHPAAPKLTLPHPPNTGPTRRTHHEFWTAAGATDIRGKEPFSRRGGFGKRMGFLGWASELLDRHAREAKVIVLFGLVLRRPIAIPQSSSLSGVATVVQIKRTFR